MFRVYELGTPEAHRLTRQGDTDMTTTTQKYRMHADFAAGFSEQQMIDRDAGDFDNAAFCQERAAIHARMAREHRERMIAESIA